MAWTFFRSLHELRFFLLTNPNYFGYDRMRIEDGPNNYNYNISPNIQHLFYCSKYLWQTGVYCKTIDYGWPELGRPQRPPVELPRADQQVHSQSTPHHQHLQGLHIFLHLRKSKSQDMWKHKILKTFTYYLEFCPA